MRQLQANETARLLTTSGKSVNLAETISDEYEILLETNLRLLENFKNAMDSRNRLETEIMSLRATKLKECQDSKHLLEVERENFVCFYQAAKVTTKLKRQEVEEHTPQLVSLKTTADALAAKVTLKEVDVKKKQQQLSDLRRVLMSEFKIDFSSDNSYILEQAKAKVEKARRSLKSISFGYNIDPTTMSVDESNVLLQREFIVFKERLDHETKDDPQVVAINSKRQALLKKKVELLKQLGSSYP